MKINIPWDMKLEPGTDKFVAGNDDYILVFE